MFIQSELINKAIHEREYQRYNLESEIMKKMNYETKQCYGNIICKTLNIIEHNKIMQTKERYKLYCVVKGYKYELE